MAVDEKAAGHPSSGVRVASSGARRLLIVDDDPTICRSVSTVFSHRGYQVRVAATLAEALMALEHAPDVIVLDIRLPDGSGVDVAREAQKLHPVPRIVAASGLARLTESFELGRLWVQEFVEKPYVADELEAAIQRALAWKPDLANAGAQSVGKLGFTEARSVLRLGMGAEAMARANGSISQAARLLGVSRQGMQHLAKELKEDLPEE